MIIFGGSTENFCARIEKRTFYPEMTTGNIKPQFYSNSWEKRQRRRSAPKRTRANAKKKVDAEIDKIPIGNSSRGG